MNLGRASIEYTILCRLLIAFVFNDTQLAIKALSMLYQAIRHSRYTLVSLQHDIVGVLTKIQSKISVRWLYR